MYTQISIKGWTFHGAIELCIDGVRVKPLDGSVMVDSVKFRKGQLHTGIMCIVTWTLPLRPSLRPLVYCVWNVTAHAQKPDFPLSPKRTSPFKSAGASVQSTAGSVGVRISGSNAGYTRFRGSVKSTGYPLHSLVSPSLSPLVRHRMPSGFKRTLTGTKSMD
jgi:hypothetical protein